ncbi:50S ribosomal protein L10 [Fibrobacterota bacterium]
MITKEQKEQVVKDLSEKVNAATGIYLADFIGINVEQITELRSALKKQGARMIVTKNTFLRRVLSQCQITGLEVHLAGPTSIILAGEEDPIAPAKIIADFHKANKDLFPVKAIRIEDQIYSGEKIKDISKMPGKRELQAQIISLALSPGAQLIGLIKGPGSKIAGQIKALVEKLEKQ